MASRSAPNRRNVKSGSDAAADVRERPKDYLNEAEIADLLQAAKRGRHGIRDHLLVLMMYRHGLRVSEATGLRRDDIDLDQAGLPVADGQKTTLSRRSARPERSELGTAEVLAHLEGVLSVRVDVLVTAW